MINDLLLAEDLLDAISNPSRTMEEHETGAARIATLAMHGVNIDVASFEGETTATGIDLLPGHVWRWALNESKQWSEATELHARLPQRDVLQALYIAEIDRVERLLLMESTLTHPEAETKLSELDELRNPVALGQLPNVWPRDYLIELCRGAETDSEGRSQNLDLAELGMMLLQIATSGTLALLGATIVTLRERGRENHPLIQDVRAFIGEENEELAQRLGLGRRPDRFT